MATKIHESQVAQGIFTFTGTDVNWVIVEEGEELTLIDAGWHGDTQRVEQSIRSIGRRPEDVRAIVLTHAHADHTGALTHLHDNYGVPYYMAAAEIPNALGTAVESAGPIDVAKRLYRPKVMRWTAQVVEAGGLRHFTFPAAQPFPQDGPLDLPGNPVPIPTPGHTSGHISYLIPGAGVVITGDALVTAHPTLKGVGPRLLPSFFAHDQPTVVESLRVLRELDVDTFVPGHGPTWFGPISAAADQALDLVDKG